MAKSRHYVGTKLDLSLNLHSLLNVGTYEYRDSAISVFNIITFR